MLFGNFQVATSKLLLHVSCVSGWKKKILARATPPGQNRIIHPYARVCTFSMWRLSSWITTFFFLLFHRDVHRMPNIGLEFTLCFIFFPVVVGGGGSGGALLVLLFLNIGVCVRAFFCICCCHRNRNATTFWWIRFVGLLIFRLHHLPKINFRIHFPPPVFSLPVTIYLKHVAISTHKHTRS